MLIHSPEGSMQQDKRKRSRVQAGLEALLTCGGKEKHPIRVRNVSLKGVLCDPDPELGQLISCHLHFALSGGIRFTVEARIIRNDESGLAMDFEGMDEEAFLHLRNLVRYNAPDADAIDRELTVPAFTDVRAGK
jgi:hypothetical protein